MKTELQNNAAASRALRLLPVLLLALLVLAGCKTSRQGASLSPETGYLSSKVLLTVPYKEGTMTVNGSLKLKSGECLQLSFLMPILRSELARMEVMPDEVLVVDRMGKRYVRATRKELKRYLPRKADFSRLEKLLYAAAKPDGKRTLTGAELGIPSLEKARIELSSFSDKPFSLTPTQLSGKYKEVALEELIDMLSGMLK